MTEDHYNEIYLYVLTFIIIINNNITRFWNNQTWQNAEWYNQCERMVTSYYRSQI